MIDRVCDTEWRTLPRASGLDTINIGPSRGQIGTGYGMLSRYPGSTVNGTAPFTPASQAAEPFRAQTERLAPSGAQR
jgi:hypothetical protein